MHEAIKDVFGSIFEAILNGEMENYLGYGSNSKSEKSTENRRNGYSDKKLKTSMGETEISIPRDRATEFESMLIPKYKRDVSDIDGKILAMYARGMSQRDISATIDDIYGFKLSAEQISKITDFVLEEQRNWQNRPLKPFYPFVFVDCLYVSTFAVTMKAETAPFTRFWRTMSTEKNFGECKFFCVSPMTDRVSKPIKCQLTQNRGHSHIWLVDSGDGEQTFLDANFR